MTTVSTSSGRRFARATAAPIATAPRLGAGTSLRLPPNVPIAVRTGSAKTTERCDVMVKSPELTGQFLLPRSCATGGLNLRQAAIDEQFRSRDVAGVVGGEKHHGFGDLIGRAESAERDRAGKHLQSLLANLRRTQQITQPGRVSAARAYCVHANAARLQVCRPGPREGAYGGFGRAINTIRCQPFASDDGRVKNNGGAIRHQGKRLLHREEQALHIDVEDRVIKVLGYRPKRRIFRNTGVGE